MKARRSAEESDVALFQISSLAYAINLCGFRQGDSPLYPAHGASNFLNLIEAGRAVVQRFDDMEAEEERRFGKKSTTPSKRV